MRFSGRATDQLKNTRTGSGRLRLGFVFLPHPFGSDFVVLSSFGRNRSGRQFCSVGNDSYLVDPASSHMLV